MNKKNVIMDSVPLDFIKDFNFLTPTQAIIVYLHDEQDLDFNDIASVLGRYSHNIRAQYDIASDKIDSQFKESVKELEGKV